jgi:hypothetical protein
MSKIEVNAIEPQCGTTLTLGASGDTVTLASGASQTGFGRTGTVDWQTGSIKTSTFTAANGEGYFADTSSGTFVMNLPAGSAGNIVSVVDYTRTFQTNSLTISPNGSQKIGGVAQNASLTTEGQSVTFVYVDDTEGWVNVQDSTSAVIGVAPFITATGGTIATCGDFKTHTFTGPGTFCVSAGGSPLGSDVLEYIVVGGGGGGGGCAGNLKGGAGGGGFRFASPTLAPATYPGKPLAAPAGLTASIGAIPVTVGAGGAGNPGGGSSGGNAGSNTTFSTIISAGGGTSGGDGGSGGGGNGGSLNSPGGSGNTPPVSPPQGNNGGTSATSSPDHASGGGGGAIAVGTNGRTPSSPGSGNGGDGAGIPTAFGSNGVPCGSFRYYAGGGGGGAHPGVSTPAGSGGKGGGGAGAGGAATAGTANSGGGGGAGGNCGPSPGGTGGSGIVIIRYKFQ